KSLDLSVALFCPSTKSLMLCYTSSILEIWWKKGPRSDRFPISPPRSSSKCGKKLFKKDYNTYGALGWEFETSRESRARGFCVLARRGCPLRRRTLGQFC